MATTGSSVRLKASTESEHTHFQDGIGIRSLTGPFLVLCFFLVGVSDPNCQLALNLWRQIETRIYRPHGRVSFAWQQWHPGHFSIMTTRLFEGNPFWNRPFIGLQATYYWDAQLEFSKWNNWWLEDDSFLFQSPKKTQWPVLVNCRR